MLTEKQQNVLNAIKDYISKNNGASPSYGDIMKILPNYGMNIKSTRGLVQYLEALEKKQCITRSLEHRSIKITESPDSSNFVDVPLYGTANAGSALAFAEDNIEGFLKISKKLLKSVDQVFALKVSGDSMNSCEIDGNLIEDQDFVLIDRFKSVFNNNDIVLAIIDSCATIKQLKKTQTGDIMLNPVSKNSTHQPIYVDESDSFAISGIVFRVLKSQYNI